MSDSDISAKPNPGTLLSRLVTLARLSERVGRLSPRGVLLDKMLQRMLLFSRMTDRLGIAAAESPLMRAVLREAELGCLECTAWRQCRRWLDGRSPDEDYGDFCPNEGLFGVLPRQDNVRHPYAPE